MCIKGWMKANGCRSCTPEHYIVTEVCVFICICVYTYTCACVLCMHALVCFMYVCMHVSTSPRHVCACTCLLKYVCVRMYTCMYCLVTYSHTHKCAWQPEIDVLKHFLWSSLLVWIGTSQWTWSALILPRLASQQDPALSPHHWSHRHTQPQTAFM